MPVTNLKALVGKLNATCRRCVEEAAYLSLQQTNYEVQIEHWFLKLLERSDSDFVRILKHYDVNTTKANKELTETIEKFQRGNSRNAPSFSPELLELIREAWLLASLEFGSPVVRSGYLLTALLNESSLLRKLRDGCPEICTIKGHQLFEDVQVLIRGTGEDKEAPPTTTSTAPAGDRSEPHPTSPDSKTPSLDQFTMNLTHQAKDGKIDPVIGRSAEIRQVIDILTRRRQNNPILAGEAGVGKTAVVEGFALQIVSGDVPPPLRTVEVRTLDLGLLQAGAGVRGEFENRLKSVINEVKASPVPIILFIDEAHTLIGAGGGSGQGDAANLLKPALARGELRTIAATTWQEYKKYFETDPALKRRFQLVRVEEPDAVKAVRMMRGIAGTMEKHHNVRVLDEAISDAVKLSQRYITDRQLPDKSVSLLDTACARVSLTQHAIPAPIEDCRRELEQIAIEQTIRERETAAGGDHSAELEELKEHKESVKTRLASLERQWEAEKKIVAELFEVRQQLDEQIDSRDSQAQPSTQEVQLREKLNQLGQQLTREQGQDPLVFPVVSGEAVAEVVAGWTGIPVGKMVRDEIQTVLALQDKLEERVIGQAHALKSIAERIRSARANLTDPRRPIGVFLLLGPSGVGKTETALALADILYGGDRNVVTINMSEYKSEAMVSRLAGSSPGLVGYGEGGVLSEAVRRRPYSIVLLDEIEKAHISAQEFFYQVFDKGTLQDDRGNDIDFKNTIILLTSNIGTDTITRFFEDPDNADKADDSETIQKLVKLLRNGHEVSVKEQDDENVEAPQSLPTRPSNMPGELLQAFKPAFLGRLEVVPYLPLAKDVLVRIIRLKLNQVRKRIRENHRAEFDYSDSVVDVIASRCQEVETGARNVDHIITGTLLPALANEFLTRMAQDLPIQTAQVSVDEFGNFEYRVS